MLEPLLGLDHSAFFAINGTLAAGTLGAIFVFVSRLGDWGAVWLAFCFLVLWLGRGDEESHRVVVLTIAATLVAELLTVLLKTAIARPRPGDTLAHVNVLAQGLGGYSFPSAHAVRSFAAAGVLSTYSKLRPWRLGLWVLASGITLSRVVVGAHFPADVVAGAVVGSLVAWLFVTAGRHWEAARLSQGVRTGSRHRTPSGDETDVDG